MPPLPRFYFQDSLNVRSYDARAALDATLFEDHLPFYVALAVESGGPVLELGCGTGRVALAIAEAGVEVVGLDLAPAMLAQAEAARARATGPVQARLGFEQGDMTDFDLGRRFALVLVPFRSFQELLTVHDQRSALACIRGHLEPGGRLAADLFDPRYEAIRPGVDDSVVSLPAVPSGDGTIRVDILRRVNDPVAQRLTEVWRFTAVAADGTPVLVEEEVHSLRWIFRYEMRHLLDLEGFAVESEASDFHGSPPAYGNQQVWIARRR
ncbi:MAG: class I SAM-dependent methyltransferase [Alphaproteobacteria bacterium]